MGTPLSQQQNKQQPLIKHPKFNQANWYGLPRQLQITIHYLKETDITKWQRQYTPLLEHQSLLLPVYFSKQKQGLCSQQGLCKIRYENYSNVLKEEIRERNEQVRLGFKNEQIWYIVLTLLQAAHALHSKKKKVGDIRPANIFINQQGKMKIANQYSFPNQLINYDKTLLEKESTFLAPEQMSSLMFSKHAQTNYELAETFSIGLTLLDVVLLTNSEQLYDFLAFKINFQMLNERKGNLSKQEDLDPILKAIVLGFLEIDSSYRASCCDIYRWLKTYENQVMKFKPFCIVDWPWIRSQTLIERNSQIRKINGSRDKKQGIQPVELTPATDLFSKFRQSEKAQEWPSNKNPFSRSNLFDRPVQQPIDLPASKIDKKIQGPNNFEQTLNRIDEQLQRSSKTFHS